MKRVNRFDTQVNGKVEKEVLGEADPYNYDPYYSDSYPGYSDSYPGYSDSYPGYSQNPSIDQEALLQEYYASFPQDPECKNCEQRPYIVKGDAGSRGNAGFPGPQGEAVSFFIQYISLGHF